MPMFATNITQPPQAVTVGNITIQQGDTALVTGVSPDVLRGLHASGHIRMFGTSPADAQIGNNARSYSCQYSWSSLASLGTDIMSIQGSAGALVFVSKIVISGATALTALNADVSLIRRSTLTTGGTSVQLTPVQHDTRDAAAAAKCWAWTAAPSSLGTAVGTPFRRNPIPLLPVGNQNQPYSWIFGDDAKAVVLASATESLCINLNGTTLAASLSVAIEFFEIGT